MCVDVWSYKRLGKFDRLTLAVLGPSGVVYSTWRRILIFFLSGFSSTMDCVTGEGEPFQLGSVLPEAGCMLMFRYLGTATRISKLVTGAELVLVVTMLTVQLDAVGPSGLEKEKTVLSPS